MTYALGPKLRRAILVGPQKTMDDPSYEPAAALDFFKAGGESSIPAGRTIFHENRRGRRFLLQRDKMYLLPERPGQPGRGKAGPALGEVGRGLRQMAALANLPRSATRRGPDALPRHRARPAAVPQGARPEAGVRPHADEGHVARLREAVTRFKRRDLPPAKTRRRSRRCSIRNSSPTWCAACATMPVSFLRNQVILEEGQVWHAHVRHARGARGGHDRRHAGRSHRPGGSAGRARPARSVAAARERRAEDHVVLQPINCNAFIALVKLDPSSAPRCSRRSPSGCAISPDAE